jgi:hypothetical protein
MLNGGHMTFISYDTENGSYPGGVQTMTLEQAHNMNESLRHQGEPVRWIMPSCDSCDTRSRVDYVDGQMLCPNCR